MNESQDGHLKYKILFWAYFAQFLLLRISRTNSRRSIRILSQPEIRCWLVNEGESCTRESFHFSLCMSVLRPTKEREGTNPRESEFQEELMHQEQPHRVRERPLNRIIVQTDSAPCWQSFGHSVIQIQQGIRFTQLSCCCCSCGDSCRRRST